MATIHIVKQGEHLAGIAKQHGFGNHLKLWDLPENAALKKLRQNPNILFPGDQIFIPDRQPSVVEVATDQVHRFRLISRKLKLRLALREFYNQPLAGLACELDVAGHKFQLTTDGEGRLEHDIPVSAEEASLTIVDPSSPLSGTTIPLEIGHLDPVAERSGQRARLSNLGYATGPSDGTDDDQAFTAAVEEFQCDHGLSVDGKCGPRTQAKLLAAHGC